MMREQLLKQLNLSQETVRFCEEREQSLSAYFQQIDRTAEYNQWKVLEAMQTFRVAERHFGATTGYGYNDDGRDTLEKVYAAADIRNERAGGGPVWLSAAGR